MPFAIAQRDEQVPAAPSMTSVVTRFTTVHAGVFVLGNRQL